jgi:hypothetical protein
MIEVACKYAEVRLCEEEKIKAAEATISGDH